MGAEGRRSSPSSSSSSSSSSGNKHISGEGLGEQHVVVATRQQGKWMMVCFSHLIFQDAILQNQKLWLLIQKKFGFYSKSQYKNWQKQLAEDPTWPPTNRTDYSGDGKNGFYINRGYETSEEIPKGKLDW